jgi:2-methylcitrate dehydratase PrpD
MTEDAACLDDLVAWAWDGPPAGGPAEAQARRLLLDSLGCAMAGLRHPRVAAFAAALAGPFAGTLRLPGIAAELAPGGATLGEALGSYALSYEVAARAGEVWRLRPSMHVDGSWHALGAAAAAARLAGLDVSGAGRAVRLVACQIPFSLYAPIAAGLDGRNSYPAHAVLLGLAAASAAAAGMDAPSEGFAAARRIALGAEAPARRAPAGAWLLEEGYVKAFAGVRATPITARPLPSPCIPPCAGG